MVGAVVLAKRHVGVAAVDRARGGQHQVSHRMQTDRFEKVEGSGKIGVQIGARIVEAVANPRLRGQVDHHVDGRLGQQSLQGSHVLQVKPVFAITGIPGQDRCAIMLQDEVVIGRERIDADHLVTAVEQTVRHVEADEPRGACHKKTHPIDPAPSSTVPKRDRRVARDRARDPRPFAREPRASTREPQARRTPDAGRFTTV
jgi:hypothetical protein